MATLGAGAQQLRDLSRRLKEAGTDGQGLRRALRKQIRDAAEPLAREISRLDHLVIYMPDRYAAVLAGDLSVRVSATFSGSPHVQVRAQARAHKRKLQYLDKGFINHPIFARGPRALWDWSNGQTGGMEAGFFTIPCEDSAPEFRSAVLAAMTETAQNITGR